MYNKGKITAYCASSRNQTYKPDNKNYTPYSERITQTKLVKQKVLVKDCTFFIVIVQMGLTCVYIHMLIVKIIKVV